MLSFTEKRPKLFVNRACRTPNTATKARSEEEMKGQCNIRSPIFKRDSIVETLIMSGRFKGVWIKATLLGIGKNKFDLAVECPKKWKVAEIALNVPAQLIRDVTEPSSYTVPVEFPMDSTVICLKCDSNMTIRDLKEAVYKEKKFSWNQLYFLCNGIWLINSDAIPDDRIFCIIHRGGRLTSHLINMVSTLNQKRRSPSLSSDSEEISSPWVRSTQSSNHSKSRYTKNLNPSSFQTSKCSSISQSSAQRSLSKSSLKEKMLGDPITHLCDRALCHMDDGRSDNNFEADIELMQKVMGRGEY